MSTGPLLVFGPRSATYDFGPSHPLTPRRFGPGIELLRAVGAAPGLAPEPAADDELTTVHTARYLRAVRRLSADPDGPPEAGIGPGDDPPFAGMHEAAASVAGGSLRAMEAIIRGEVEHVFHPGGGLHHAMPDRASGFCIYDDPALAIARARAAGLRVLYVDLDVHHGDGVQAIHASDPGVMSISVHESGRYLFPGTGAASELGTGLAAGTVVNVPLEPLAGDLAWLEAVETIVPLLAASFGPDVVVSQHGSDSHAWDPLAHLRVTTSAMGRAARLVDAVAHEEARGGWLATGGGGYDAYRVVPRAWALTWLAGAHRAAPEGTPAAWRARWAADAARYGQAPLPDRFLDEPNAGLSYGEGPAAADRRSTETVRLVRAVAVPALLREAADRGWWRPPVVGAATGSSPASPPVSGPAGRPAADAPTAPPASSQPTLVGPLDRAALERLRLAPRVVMPVRPVAAGALLAAAADAGATIAGAVAGDVLVAVAVVGPSGDASRLLAVGVAPDHRGDGLATAVLRRAVTSAPPDRAIEALVTVAERDPLAPEDVALRRTTAERLLRAAGFRLVPPPQPIAAIDGSATAARLER